MKKPTADDRIRGEIEMICATGRVNKEGLAKIIGITRSVFYKRFNEPEQFTLADVRNMRVYAKHLGLEVTLQ